MFERRHARGPRTSPKYYSADAKPFEAPISKHMRALEVRSAYAPRFCIDGGALSRWIAAILAAEPPHSEDRIMKVGIILGSLAIVALLGAVAVTAGYGDFLSSIVTGPKADRITSAAPSRQPGAQQPGAVQPVPPPPTAQLPPPAPPAPVANDSASSAKTASAADKAGGAPSAQAGTRVAAEDILVPAENGARRTALTAEEKAAVARGLKELGLTTANATSSPQSEQATTAELNRKALAGSVAAEEARSQQLQAQNRQ